MKDGNKVKLTVKFKGREMAHQEIGYQVLQDAINLLGDKASIEKEPKMEGRKLSMIVGKGRKDKNAETKNEQVSI